MAPGVRVAAAPPLRVGLAANLASRTSGEDDWMPGVRVAAAPPLRAGLAANLASRTSGEDDAMAGAASRQWASGLAGSREPGLDMNRLQEPDGHEGHEHRRAAVAHQRQRHAGHGH